MEELEHVIRQNDSGTQKTKKSIQLIILKKITRIKYYQSCEVKLKKHKVCITPNGENDDDSVIKVKLSSNFIKYEYAIYFPEHNGFGFALIFYHKRHCNYVFNSFQQQKVNNGNEDTQISDEMLENLFLKPLIKELHHYSTLKFDLRVFILRFLKSMDKEQKQRLAPLIISTKIDKSLIDSVLKGVDLAAADKASSSKMPILQSQETDCEAEHERYVNQRPNFSILLPAPSDITFAVNKTEMDEEGWYVFVISIYCKSKWWSS
jgi:hypothetical protein